MTDDRTVMCHGVRHTEILQPNDISEPKFPDCDIFAIISVTVVNAGSTAVFRLMSPARARMKSVLIPKISRTMLDPTGEIQEIGRAFDGDYGA